MREQLQKQLMISKGIITNYEMNVIPEEDNVERRKLLLDTLEEFKDDLASAEFFLQNGYDYEVLTNHCNNLKSFITRLKEI